MIDGIADSYFKVMKDVSLRTDAEMELLAEELVRTSYASHGAADLIFKRARSGRPKLRPLVYVLCSRVSLLNIPREIVRLAAIAELINIATYLLNLSADRKGNLSENHRSQQMLSGIVLEGFCLTSVQKMEELDTEVKLGIICAFSNGFKKVTEGLIFDTDVMSDVESCLSYDLNDFVNLYARRCALLGGESLQSICLAAANHSDSGEVSRRALARYGIMHGLALQVINDIADFLPVTRSAKSVGKSQTDQFADLRNRRVTLPVFQLCKQASSEQRVQLFDLAHVPGTGSASQMLKTLSEMDGFNDAVELARAADALAFESLEPIIDEYGDFLRNSLHVSQSNRFFNYLHRHGLIKSPLNDQHKGIINQALRTL
jgi:geranylgeranyl pyrophosphate synthase